jgi:HAMP domain-containing protein
MGLMGFNDLYSANGSAPSSGLVIGVTGVLAALAALAIRFRIRRDLKPLRRLARDGVAYRPSETKLHDGLSGEKTLRVFWREGEKEASADVELHRASIEPCLREEVIVLARPRDKLVLAVLGGNGVFVGKRRVVLWGK